MTGTPFHAPPVIANFITDDTLFIQRVEGATAYVLTDIRGRRREETGEPVTDPDRIASCRAYVDRVAEKHLHISVSPDDDFLAFDLKGEGLLRVRALRPYTDEMAAQEEKERAARRSRLSIPAGKLVYAVSDDGSVLLDQPTAWPRDSDGVIVRHVHGEGAWGHVIVRLGDRDYAVRAITNLPPPPEAVA
jgi:hypothetical protein